MKKSKESLEYADLFTKEAFKKDAINKNKLFIVLSREALRNLLAEAFEKGRNESSL